MKCCRQTVPAFHSSQHNNLQSSFTFSVWKSNIWPLSACLVLNLWITQLNASVSYKTFGDFYTRKSKEGKKIVYSSPMSKLYSWLYSRIYIRDYKKIVDITVFCLSYKVCASLTAAVWNKTVSSVNNDRWGHTQLGVLTWRRRWQVNQTLYLCWYKSILTLKNCDWMRLTHSTRCHVILILFLPTSKWRPLCSQLLLYAALVQTKLWTSMFCMPDLHALTVVSIPQSDWTALHCFKYELHFYIFETPNFGVSHKSSSSPLSTPQSGKANVRRIASEHIIKGIFFRNNKKFVLCVPLASILVLLL